LSALDQLAAPTARVLRNGDPTVLPTADMPADAAHPQRNTRARLTADRNASGQACASVGEPSQ
jgi:hypothetical protein